MKPYDVKAVMVTAGKYNRVLAEIRNMDWMISCVNDVYYLKRYFAKKTFYEREARKLKKRLDAVRG